MRRRGRRNVKIAVTAAVVLGGVGWYITSRPVPPPTIGTDLPGWERVPDPLRAREPGHLSWSTPTATFRAEAGATTPVVLVSANDEDLDYGVVGDQIHLGDDMTAYASDDDGTQPTEVNWFEDDGTAVFLAAWDVPYDDVLAYAGELARDNVTAQHIDEPDGLPVADRGTRHSEPAVSDTTYTRGESRLTIEVRDDTGWLESRLDDIAHRNQTEVTVGANPLGAGTAVLNEVGRGWVALWSTPDGLAVQVTASGPLAEGTVRELLEGGHLVEVDE